MAALAGGALFACGAAAAPGPLTVHIALHDHGFGFRNIGIRAAQVRLEVAIRGHKRHDLVLSRAGHKGAGQAHAIASTRPLKPGQSTTLMVKLKPGRYRIYSKLDHDGAQGLSAPLVVMAPSVKGGAEMSRVFYNFH